MGGKVCLLFIGDPFGFIGDESRKELMTFLTGYFDESGKFKDHKVVSFAGFVGDVRGWEMLHMEWMRLLAKNGLKVMKACKAIRYQSPLSKKMPALGVDARVNALMPFLKATRYL